MWIGARAPLPRRPGSPSCFHHEGHEARKGENREQAPKDSLILLVFSSFQFLGDSVPLREATFALVTVRAEQYCKCQQVGLTPATGEVFFDALIFRFVESNFFASFKASLFLMGRKSHFPS